MLPPHPHWLPSCALTQCTPRPHIRRRTLSRTTSTCERQPLSSTITSPPRLLLSNTPPAAKISQPKEAKQCVQRPSLRSLTCLCRPFTSTVRGSRSSLTRRSRPNCCSKLGSVSMFNNDSYVAPVMIKPPIVSILVEFSIGSVHPLKCHDSVCTSPYTTGHNDDLGTSLLRSSSRMQALTRPSSASTDACCCTAHPAPERQRSAGHFQTSLQFDSTRCTHGLAWSRLIHTPCSPNGSVRAASL